MELEQRLKQQVDGRDDYQYQNRSDLRDKRVIALLGPSAVGKSRIIQTCLERAGAWELGSVAEAGTSTTRPGRPSSDPTNYHTDIPHEEMVEMIENNELVNWSLFETGHVYATLPEDFPAEYNFMACLPDSVPMLRKAGFAAVHAVYVVTTVDAWETQLASRLFTPDSIHLPKSDRMYNSDARGRVEEAIDSIEYCFRNEYLNPMLRLFSATGEENLPNTADIILEKAKKPDHYSIRADKMRDDFERNIRSMYSRAIDLAWEIEQATGNK